MLLPYQQITLDLPYDLTEAQRRLTAVIQPHRSLLESLAASFRIGPRQPRYFNGTFDGRQFRVVREISYSNSFLPVITGSLLQGPSGTQVTLRLALHPLVAAFLLLFWGLPVFMFARAYLHGAHIQGRAFVTPLVMALVPLVACAIGFLPEASIALRRFREVLLSTTSEENAVA